MIAVGVRSQEAEGRRAAAPGSDVILTEWTWKTPAMRTMTRAVLHLALERGVIGEFSAMDLAEHGEEAHGGSGIAGSVFRQLAEAQIIAPVGAFIDGEFYQRRVRNAAGNPVGVWRLAEHGLAAALLERMGGAAMRVDQLEMAMGGM